MVTSTDDNVLRQDMPSALQKVESAAKLLEEAAKMSQVPLSLFDMWRICSWNLVSFITLKHMNNYLKRLVFYNLILNLFWYFWAKTMKVFRLFIMQFWMTSKNLYFFVSFFPFAVELLILNSFKDLDKLNKVMGVWFKIWSSLQKMFKNDSKIIFMLR